MKSVLSYLCGIVPDAEDRLMNSIADTHKYNLWHNLRLPPRDRMEDDYSRRNKTALITKSICKSSIRRAFFCTMLKIFKANARNAPYPTGAYRH